ncbi:MAG TPA: ABC transporter ATP-binding protein [Anaerolineae bacterium]|nr:ABC transporter ATP-binding protein [Anaerolineae bacterium]HQK14227.1 ABC transporter ATP-binding protein [Anaerolineae bacterium]
MIEMERLSKQFDTLLAVDNITLTVQPGEVLALLGPNGAGKTTTIRMLSAILKPTAGRARIAGYDVATQGHMVRRNVGVLTEAPGLYSRMSGREYLDFFGQVCRLSTKARKERIAFLAEAFKMSHALDRRLGEYSRGMAQKIALMRALLHDPPVLLLDEPTSAMDPESARLVRDTILQLRSDAQRTIIVCTHNLPEAEELADRIAIIRQGQIIEYGTAAELKARLLGPPLMEIRLLHAPHNGAVALIERFATVSDYGADWVRYRTPDPTMTNPALLRALATSDIPVVTLSEVAQSLEAVYLRVVWEGKQGNGELGMGSGELGMGNGSVE